MKFVAERLNEDAGNPDAATKYTANLISAIVHYLRDLFPTFAGTLMNSQSILNE